MNAKENRNLLVETNNAQFSRACKMVEQDRAMLLNAVDLLTHTAEQSKDDLTARRLKKRADAIRERLRTSGTMVIL